MLCIRLIYKKNNNQILAISFQQCSFIILSAHWSLLAFQFIILPLWSALGQYVISENSLVVVCLCSLPLHFVDWWHQQTQWVRPKILLAIEAKWNIVCPGPQPSPPLGLWPRWTVIKQGCAESALHISMPPHSINFFFIYAALWQVFFQWRSQPYVCFCIYISWCA